MDLFLFSATAAASLFQLKANQVVEKRELSASELSRQFPSLDLSKTPITGLLFAAGWCPDCTDAVPVIEKVAASSPERIRIHYISSDTSQEEMAKFYNDRVFAAIPFGNESERTALKRHFGACAKKEMVYLGIKDRKHGIPTLILLDAATGWVLTTDGVGDCVNAAASPEKAVEVWMSLLSSK